MMGMMAIIAVYLGAGFLLRRLGIRRGRACRAHYQACSASEFAARRNIRLNPEVLQRIIRA
jgi:hypothetical protein